MPVVMVRVCITSLTAGKTKVEPKENEKDLSLPTLLADFVGVIEQVFPDPKAVSLIVRCT